MKDQTDPERDDWHDLVTLDQIGRELLKSKASDPSKAASRALSRLGIKPFTYHRPEGSSRPRAYYYRSQVEEALKSRTGPGARTDIDANDNPHATGKDTPK